MKITLSSPDLHHLMWLYRLLLDRHLTIFEGYTPEWYVLMPRVSEIERSMLMRTANLRVIAYSDHEEVRTFLEALRAGYLDYTLKKRASI